MVGLFRDYILILGADFGRDVDKSDNLGREQWISGIPTEKKRKCRFQFEVVGMGENGEKGLSSFISLLGLDSC